MPGLLRSILSGSGSPQFSHMVHSPSMNELSMGTECDAEDVFSPRASQEQVLKPKLERWSSAKRDLVTGLGNPGWNPNMSRSVGADYYDSPKSATGTMWDEIIKAKPHRVPAAQAEALVRP